MVAGRKISNYLKLNGISQAHLSRKTGIDTSKMNLILAEKRKLSLSDYELICGALGVPIDKFIEPRVPEFVISKRGKARCRDHPA